MVSADRFSISIHAPARGATLVHTPTRTNLSDFNPRPPRGGATSFSFRDTSAISISIHAPREGGDSAGNRYIHAARYLNPRPPRGGRHSIGYEEETSPTLFQSTPPARGATIPSSCRFRTAHRFQSTPPARGATGASGGAVPGAHYFNPRPPRGGRPAGTHFIRPIKGISIHAPREGGDHLENVSLSPR